MREVGLFVFWKLRKLTVIVRIYIMYMGIKKLCDLNIMALNRKLSYDSTKGNCVITKGSHPSLDAYSRFIFHHHINYIAKMHYICKQLLHKYNNFNIYLKQTMKATVHIGHYRLFYQNQTSYQGLLEQITDIFEEYNRKMHGEDNQYGEEFDILYVDDECGEWMLVENQRDLNLIIGVNRGRQMVLKVLPKVPIPQQPPKKPGKLNLTDDMKKLGNNICQQYIDRMIQRQAIQQYLDETYNKISDKLSIMSAKKPTKNIRIKKHSISPKTYQILDKQFEDKQQCRPIRKISISPKKSVNCTIQPIITQLVQQRLKAILPDIHRAVTKNLQQKYKNQLKIAMHNSSQPLSVHKQIEQSLRQTLKEMNPQQ